MRIESRYRWAGKVETSSEWRLDAKTTAVLARRLADRIGTLHPYETPEVLILPVSGASPGYAGWVAAEVSGSSA
ncbi:divalent-cation tolerance protein CutA [Parvularcula dongshanensis]|uniref:Uncharacterized protein involved in tolerance to divalent cations n=1 Tax=Parvularcula dongshanensis TaxID=1173995 RepID=A0A840I1B0_9PROT|nr:uncharacterized protein involved in tolerance to divalent cations [Parvularcula dongshanensis]